MVVPTFYLLRQFQDFVIVPTYIFQVKQNFRKQIPYALLTLNNVSSFGNLIDSHKFFREDKKQTQR
ncbi:hypothetical protein LEP1GSC008_0011 [Leptospira kirschneri serovar Bulgarica str. Nikolaevo]|uniref:Uncharacterized protein n=1 Tax=Leptospira kirschneri serovar Bulgarica str. Nikolaevo TaxID=1240687 RepID=M6F3V8_9LEPT|nr:hypothetical protein LEP1GSC008_0011 [Leptospira kirschneri serovar Bulgarica str. Nikolaevo]